MPNETQPPQPMPQVGQKAHASWYIAGLAILLIMGSVVAWFYVSHIAPAQSEKVYRIGILDALDYFTPTIDGFKEKMTEMGYVEGKNISYEIVKAPQPVGNDAVIKKFVDEKVDLILAFPTEAALEAKKGTEGTNVPVIFTEPALEGTDLVQSIQNPGGNLTGVRFPVPEVASKRFEILHEIAPSIKKVWIPYLKGYPTVPAALDAIRPQAEQLGITLVEAPFTTPDEMASYLKEREKNPGIDSVLLVPEPVSIIPAFTDQIHAFADSHSFPVASAIVLDSEKGPIFSFIPDAHQMGQLAAPLADKIFHGTPPGVISVITPESVFVINDKAIQRLHLKVSDALLSTANKIVH